MEPAVAERLWRARKNHTWIDAQLRPISTDGRLTSADCRLFELRFFYDGELVFNRSWPTREAAVSFAAQRLSELQRVGWNTHW